MRRGHRAAWMVLFLGVGPWGAPGCTSVVPETLRAEVDPRLTYVQLAQDPEAYRGRLVVMGGEVVQVESAGRDLELTLVERPLSPADESPMLGVPSRGGLLVRVPGAARASLREGQVVTVVGTVLGRESSGSLDPVPHLEARHLHLWPVGSLPRHATEPRW